MVCHPVTIPTHLKSVALPTLFFSLPNRCRPADVSQAIALLTFVNCHNSDEMWSDVLNVALPTFVYCCNSDEMCSDVLNVALPTFVNCRNSDEMWSDVFKMSQVRRLQGVGIPTAGSI